MFLFYFSGKFDGGDIDVGQLDVDVQDTLGHFVVHCHQTRPLLVAPLPIPCVVEQ